MIRFNALAAGVLVLCATGSAFAQDDAASEPGETASAQADIVSPQSSAAGDKKFKLGLRLGYAVPSGKVTGPAANDLLQTNGDSLSNGITGQIPIWLDVGYMVTPNVLLGLYGQYGFASVKDCATGFECSAHDIRFGVQGQFHILPAESVDPWLGVGFGYESLGISTSGQGLSGDGTFKGWEFLNLQGGVDFRATDAITVGPFLSVSFDQYSSESVSYSNAALGPNASADITDKALHEWITFGAKGTFGI